MALLTATTLSRAGVVASADGATPTASTGDTFANTGSELAIITNGSGSGITVTITIPTTVDGTTAYNGNAVTNPTVSIADGATKIIGPFPIGIYNDANGLVKLTCSAVTSSKIKIVKQVINQ